MKFAYHCGLAKFPSFPRAKRMKLARGKRLSTVAGSSTSPTLRPQAMKLLPCGSMIFPPVTRNWPEAGVGLGGVGVDDRGSDVTAHVSEFRVFEYQFPAVFC